MKNGRVENEGDVQVPPMKPYPISYRSLVPKAAECENLFVPVCLAASHIAYGSIRMEPVFMILGQSAATAASLALEGKVSVQKVPYEKLRARLLADGQVLEWKSEPSPAAQATGSLKGLVLDDADAEKSGPWIESGNPGARLTGTGYLHDGDSHKGEVSITYTPEIPRAGEYEIFLLSPPHANRGFASLGRFQLPAGKGTSVRVSNQDTDGHVVADGVQFVPVP